MKTIFKLQYLISIAFLWTIFSSTSLQAQCHTLIDFTDAGIVPDGCGTTWTENNQLIHFYLEEVDADEYTCNSTAASCTILSTEDGLFLENSVLRVDGKPIRTKRLSFLFLDTIGEADVEVRFFIGNTFLQTLYPTTSTTLVVEDTTLLNEASHFEVLACGVRLSSILFDYDCLEITEGAANYCNLFDELDNATISYNQGDFLFNLDGIPVYGQPNYSESGSFWLNDFIVSDTLPDGSPYLTGTNIYLTNALHFDFTALEESVNQVRFAWSESGNLPTPINIQVNDEPLVIAHDIRDVTSIAPNVSLIVTGELPQMVTLTGEIEHLTIGGVETNMSLFCYETNKATLQNEWGYCLSFEGLMPVYYGFNNSYSAGDFVFAEDGVEAYFEEFDFDGSIWEDPSMDIIESASTVGEPQILFDSGQFIYLNATNLHFDFGKLEGQVQQLQIDYVWGGSTVNLQVNGETLQVANNFTDMPSTIADGVTMTVNFNEATSNGFIALKGNIESFAIGGGEFWIDNLCFNEVPLSPPTNACLDFDNFYLTQTVPYFYNNNTEFGETIFNYNGIPLTLEVYQIGGNPTNYSAIGFDPTESTGQGSLLFFNGSAGFDFEAVEGTVGQVSFNHSVNAEDVLINLKINDFPTIETTDLVTISLPDGYEIVVSGTFNQFVTITGAIQKLIIGGDGLQIDNLCYQTSDNNGVWPGDTNNDGIANNFDLLQIGVAYNNTGSPRMNPTLAWIGQASDDWTGEFADGVNHKYADCNGDGEILLDDLEGIIQNYGKTHAKNGGKSGTAEDAPLYVELPDGDMNQGDNLTAPIILGTLEIPATDVYGIAFTVNFDSELIDPESVAVTFEDCWLGTEDENIITLSQPFGEEGTIDVAITRIDLMNQTGYGTIGTLSGIIDNIAGLKSAQQDLVVIISNVRAISANQTEMPVFPTADTVIVTDIHDEIIQQSIEVFPIPAKEYLQVRVPDLQKVRSLQFFDLTGRLVINLEKEEVVFGRNLQLDVRELQQGIYFLKLDYDGVSVSRKVVLE